MIFSRGAVAVFVAAFLLESAVAQVSEASSGRWSGELKAPDLADPIPLELVLDVRPGGEVRGSLAVPLDHSPIVGESVDGRLVFQADMDDDQILQVELRSVGERMEGTVSRGGITASLWVERSVEPLRFFHDAGLPEPAELPAATSLDSLHPSLSRRLEGLILEAARRGRVVGLSVVVVRDGEVVLVHHLGWEDLVRQVPVSEKTSYRWASVAKPMTAVAALQLVERGQLDLQSDVRDHVPEFPPREYRITPHQLLCHQGSIVHYGNGRVIRTQREYDVEHPWADTILCLDRFKDSPLVGVPGTRFQYSSHGYMLLGAVIERAGGQPFRQQVRERIAGPLEMDSLRADDPWVETPHRAVGYRGTRIGLVTRDRPEDVHWKLPAGGWISTITDLARFTAALQVGDLLDDETFELMATPQALADGQDTGYGYGLGVSEHEGRRVLSHSGTQSAAASHLLICPEEGLGVVAMSNTSNFAPWKLCRRALSLLLEDQGERELPLQIAATPEELVLLLREAESAGEFGRVLSWVPQEQRQAAVYMFWFTAAYDMIGVSEAERRPYQAILDEYDLHEDMLDADVGSRDQLQTAAAEALEGKPLVELFQDLIAFLERRRADEPVFGFAGEVTRIEESDGRATIHIGESEYRFARSEGHWYWEVIPRM